jgi:DDE superfamily endonuclease
MSDERPFFTPTAEPNGTGMNGLLAEAKASEVKYKDRCKMHVLASPEVGWTPRRIGRYLKRHPRTVRRILEQPETPTKSQRGLATTILTPDLLGSVVAYITSCRQNRLKDLPTIIHETGIICDPRTLRRALHRLGMHRALAIPKPFLTVTTKTARMTFCSFVSDWDILDWCRAICYDEAAMHRGGNRKFWVTRFPFEKYEDDCLAPKFAKIPKVMIGGAIAVDVKGPLIIFEKDKGMTNAKGNVDSNSYIDHVLPRLVEFYDEVRTHLQEREGGFSVTDPSRAEYQPLLLQDNASSHTAHRAVAALRESGMQEVPSFPPCSPDLNPIEGVWNLLKRRIYQRQPRPTKYAELIEAIREEWDALEPDDYVEFILSMPERVQAVLAANGGQTKY